MTKNLLWKMNDLYYKLALSISIVFSFTFSNVFDFHFRSVFPKFRTIIKHKFLLLAAAIGMLIVSFWLCGDRSYYIIKVSVSIFSFKDFIIFRNYKKKCNIKWKILLTRKPNHSIIMKHWKINSFYFCIS